MAEENFLQVITDISGKRLDPLQRHKSQSIVVSKKVYGSVSRAINTPRKGTSNLQKTFCVWKTF